MRVTVVGAGQMGSLYGAAAHENGHEVRLVDASQAIVDVINDIGLTIDRRDGRRDVYRIPAMGQTSGDSGIDDLVLFMVKGWATRAAVQPVEKIVGETTAILTLQNGLGNEETLRELYPKNDVLIGLSVHTVTTLGVAHYEHTGVGDTYLGPARGDDLDVARRAAAAFNGPDFPCHVLPEREIRREQWAKFVLNCGSLPSLALTRLPTDAAKDQGDVVDLIDSLTRETCEIARAEGIELDADERVAFQHELFRTAGGRASMLGDVLMKRRTEINSINGAAIRFADRHGLAAPLNRAMYALVKGLEASFEPEKA